MSLRKKALIVIVFLSILCFLFILFNRTIVNKKDEVQREHYVNAIKLINEKLPIQLDAETELRKIELNGDVIEYSYVLINKLKYEIKVPQLKESFKKEVLKTYCAHSDSMLTFRKSGYVARYIYLDSTGEEIFSSEFTPKNCEQL